MNISQLKIELYRTLEAIIGKPIIRKAYLKHCIMRYKKANCIFIHIPKAGGTSVAIPTLGQRAGHFTAEEVMNEMGQSVYNRYFSFSVSRHPVDRLYSAYTFVKQGKGEMGGVRKFKEFDSHAFRSFDAFVLEWLVEQNLSTGNILFKPQVDFVYGDGNLLVNYIGKIENTKKVSTELSNHLNREIRIGIKNRTNRESKNNISNEAVRIIENIYTKDFEYLGY